MGGGRLMLYGNMTADEAYERDQADERQREQEGR
ncbi:hypothetical protein SEA_WALELIANO_87 [Mycobacterium phage Waleliano]|uniref:Uncharacterized protein n=4 Tax=Coopervirus TaxID=1982898 RepID=A0A345KWP9_9CAUD|nr:hypothetical protein KNV18_gp82 [Mycobacterium phage Heath]AXH47451.1 hypothetical protein SEA_HANGMAN_88 [Mycobacterium phage Hangman]QBI96155.1 hypothetical protein SEA_WALELIANO_87 [Mycobacterium phage Waleliano]QOC58648.1 hypothetical protein SEALOLALOVE_90 [Mycobacterium phage Lolalove]UVK59564.1 hypothetical protein SEA_AUSTELLE_88 [Mycobacterium phage Austelle]WNM65107.1 hypothetical protein SEA_MUDSLIDE_89 [Mycobacterium phage Mudslide]